MRRAIQVWWNQGAGGHDNFSPTKIPGYRLLFIALPKKQELINRLNGLGNTDWFSWQFTALDASFPGFDDTGQPVQYAGTVVNPGDVISAGNTSLTQRLLQLCVTEFDYNSETDGDGKGAIIHADGTRGTNTASSKQDLSGANALVDTFIKLMNSIIADLKKKGEKRLAGIVQDLLRQFLQGLKSITDILDEMRKLFII